jgi:hypothetical protein
MNNEMIAKHIKALKSPYSDDSLQAAYELGELGAICAVSALSVALKEGNEDLRASAAYALGKIGDVSAVPALIATRKDNDSSVRQIAARALGKIGDAVTLPRKILADTRFSVQERISLLEMLRNVYFNDSFTTLRYKFPDTRTLCQMVLEQDDIDVKAGAQQVLNLLDGNILLRASQRATTEAQELLRGASPTEVTTDPNELLRASDASKDNTALPVPAKPEQRSRFT